MEIETARCLILPFTEQNLDDFMAYRNDMEWMRYQGFKGLTREAYREALLGDPTSAPSKQLAIVSKQSNQLIGDLYIRKAADCHWIGYTISPGHARHGYAFEAVSGLIVALGKEGVTCVKASVEPENTASIELLKKLGFLFDATDCGELVYVLTLRS